MRYFYTLVTDPFLPGGKAHLPLLDINIGEYNLPVRALLDTGSPVTIIHSPLAVAAGIVPFSGRKSSLLGVGGESLVGYYQSVPLVIAGSTYVSTVFLTADLRLPYCLLGEIGFFSHFRVVFEQNSGAFIVTPTFQ